MNFENYVLGTLSQDAFVMVNKKLAKRLGFVEAGLLAELIFTHKFAKQNNAFFEDGAKGPWFYLTQPKVEEQLGIKRREHENAIKNLVKDEILQKKKMGLPSKNYYQINWEKIVEILEDDDEKEPSTLDTDSLDETYKQGWMKRTNKDGRNVQTTLDETYNHTIYKNELEKRNTKTNNKTFVNKELNNDLENPFSKQELLDIADEFYSEFAPSRYSKQQWRTVTNQLVNEILDTKVDLKSPRRYIEASLKKIAYNHDYKNGKIDFEERFKNSRFPHYDWLNAGLEGE